MLYESKITIQNYEQINLRKDCFIKDIVNYLLNVLSFQLNRSPLLKNLREVCSHMQLLVNRCIQDTLSSRTRLAYRLHRVHRTKKLAPTIVGANRLRNISKKFKRHAIRICSAFRPSARASKGILHATFARAPSARKTIEYLVYLYTRYPIVARRDWPAALGL